MKRLLLPLLLLAACQQQPAGQVGGGNDAAAKQASEQPGRPPRLGTLIGLYEGGGTPRNQMCVVEGKGGEARFGLVVWGGNMHSCSGAGTLAKDGDKLDGKMLAVGKDGLTPPM